MQANKNYIFTETKKEVLTGILKFLLLYTFTFFIISLSLACSSSNKNKPNPAVSADTDNDGVRDVEDAFYENACFAIDGDGDGLPGEVENDIDEIDKSTCTNENQIEFAFDTCPLIAIDRNNIDASNDHSDRDGDGIGNACDPYDDTDTDNDGVRDVEDAFDTNACFAIDGDGDGLPGEVENDIEAIDKSTCTSATRLEFDLDTCPLIAIDRSNIDASNDHSDRDGDGIGNACDPHNEVDNDNDGVLNQDDAFNDNACASLDTDNDGFPDVILQDSEGNCTQDILDANEHLVEDIDKDGDGLIEIYSIEMLSNIRYSLDGRHYSDGSVSYDAGCGGVVISICVGYELMTDLDFDTDADGSFSGECDVLDVNNVPRTYTDFTGCEIDEEDVTDFFLAADSSNNRGWAPLGYNEQNRFRGVFEGNGHVIRNLFLIRNLSYVGLFGVTDRVAQIRNLGLENSLIVGSSNAGALVGLNSGMVTASYAFGEVSSTSTSIGSS